jgi:uncharacterized membrane protein
MKILGFELGGGKSETPTEEAKPPASVQLIGMSEAVAQAVIEENRKEVADNLAKREAETIDDDLSAREEEAAGFFGRLFR